MTTTNPTIGDAVFLIVEKYGFDYETREALLDRLQEAAHTGGLVVRDPLTGLPYRPVHKGLHYYLMDIVSTEDLNAWLERQGAEYRLSPEQEPYGDDAPEPEHVKNADEIPGIIPKASSCRLAVMAALEIEYETGKRATAKQTMKRLQKWADEGKHGELIKSLPDNSVEWMTTKHEAKGFDLGACGKALERWNKSRQ